VAGIPEADLVPLGTDLAEFMASQKPIQERAAGASQIGLNQDGAVGELLQKAQKIADKYHPASMTVTVGVPFGANVSFTWNT